MFISLTELRTNIYKKIDAIIVTGESLEIKRKGHIIKIIADKTPAKLSRIVKRDNIVRSDNLNYDDWLKEWNAGNDLS